MGRLNGSSVMATRWSSRKQNRAVKKAAGLYKENRSFHTMESTLPKCTEYLLDADA